MRSPTSRRASEISGGGKSAVGRDIFRGLPVVGTSRKGAMPGVDGWVGLLRVPRNPRTRTYAPDEHQRCVVPPRTRSLASKRSKVRSGRKSARFLRKIFSSVAYYGEREQTCTLQSPDGHAWWPLAPRSLPRRRASYWWHLLGV